MSYKTYEIINGELFINEPNANIESLLNKQTIEEYDDMLMEDNEPEYGSDLIDIGLDD